MYLYHHFAKPHKIIPLPSIPPHAITPFLHLSNFSSLLPSFLHSIPLTLHSSFFLSIYSFYCSFLPTSFPSLHPSLSLFSLLFLPSFYFSFLPITFPSLLFSLTSIPSTPHSYLLLFPPSLPPSFLSLSRSFLLPVNTCRYLPSPEHL